MHLLGVQLHLTFTYIDPGVAIDAPCYDVHNVSTVNLIFILACNKQEATNVSYLEIKVQYFPASNLCLSFVNYYHTWSIALKGAYHKVWLCDSEKNEHNPL